MISLHSLSRATTVMSSVSVVSRMDLPMVDSFVRFASNGRSPQSPMPRILPSTSSPVSLQQPPVPYGWRAWWDSGSILLGLGWGGLALMGLDRYLQWQQRTERQEAVMGLEEQIQRDRRQLQEEWRDKSAKFQCIIRREYKEMSGSYGLRGVLLGDVVDVLDEAVGPEQAYNLCRIHNADGNNEDVQIGWFPISFMEKVPHKKSFWIRS